MSEEGTNHKIPPSSSPTSSTAMLADHDHDHDADDNNNDCSYSLLKQLTLDEKLSLLSGQSLWATADIPRLHIPALTVSDGPHGIRKPIRELSLQESFPSTCFPTGCALACSWDVDAVNKVGVALSEEALHYNVNVLLGPGLNLKRHPAGGRNFEYFSEDPYLSGQLAAAYIQGVQSSKKVGACAKHFCVNNQESHRFVVDAIVDPRTARELYYRGFEIAVKESQPATIMCAYNKVNGVYCSENAFLNNELLRNEWGFEGAVMTDWGATNDRVAGIAAGMDLEMPGSHGAHDRAIKKALLEGRLEEKAIDASCQRILNLIDKYKGSSTAALEDGHHQTQQHEHEVDFEAHFDLAHHVAMDCVVLLKNDDNLLPLKRGTPVSLIGDFAKDHPRFQGMGSSQVNSYRVVTAFDELVARHTDTVHFAPGYHADDDHPDDVMQDLIEEAVEVAKKGDVVLLYIGLPEIMESEGFDRPHLRLPAQHNALVEEVCNAHPNVVVILSNGGAVELPPCFLKAKSILEGYLLGQSGGGAIVDLVFGVQSPCGKLAETMPMQLSDIPADAHFPGTRDVVEHREGMDVGYRYFDTANVPVRYPFGHGLSYTTFEFTNLQVRIIQDDDDEKQVEVSFELKNVGSMAGKEVAQCYVHDVKASVYRPVHELKDFTKILLEPGENRTLTFNLTKDAFAFFDIGVNDWVVEPGLFEIQIGSSSRDIRLRETVEFKTGRQASTMARESYPPCTSLTKDVDDATFAKRFGHDSSKALSEVLSRKEAENFHRNSLLKEIAATRLLGRTLMWIVYKEASKEVKPGPAYNRQKRMVRANVENLPLRTLVLFSKGGLTFEQLDTVIATLNREFCKSSKLLADAFGRTVADTFSCICSRKK